MLSLTRSEDPSNPTGLNNEFIYKGKTYPINLSFDTVISFYQLLDDDHFSAEEKITVAFQMFFGVEPRNADFAVAAFEQINDYLRQAPYGNDDDNNVSNNDMQGNVAKPIKYYSFTQDAEAIYSSFMEQYGINLLHEKQRMHWDEFKALFAGLNEKTYMSRIIQIRMRDTSKLEGQELTDAINAQQYYELDENKTEEAREQQFMGFMNTMKAWAQS